VSAHETYIYSNVIVLAVRLIAGGGVLDILIALLERPGEVVTHQELISTASSDVTVEDANLRVRAHASRGFAIDVSRSASSPESPTGEPAEWAVQLRPLRKP